MPYPKTQVISGRQRKTRDLLVSNPNIGDSGLKVLQTLQYCSVPNVALGITHLA